MYLYRFQNGSYQQSQESPTDEDQRAIEAGVLEVFTLVGGLFTQITAEKYVDVPVREHLIRDEAITEMFGDVRFDEQYPEGTL